MNEQQLKRCHNLYETCTDLRAGEDLKDIDHSCYRQVVSKRKVKSCQ